MDNTMEEYSSGCESGWTVYFEQSRGGYVNDEGCVNRSEEEEEEEEDLSMVSDASSGPAQVSHEYNNANCYINGGLFCSVSTDEDAALVRNRRMRKRSKEPRRSEKRQDQQQNVESQLLDDTASSRPDFNYTNSMNNNQQMMDFSQDHISTSYFQGGASSSAMHSHHYNQVQFQQPYQW